MKSSGRIKPRSRKTSDVYRKERVPLVQRLLEERPVCECCRRRPSEDIHEIISRGRSGGVHSTLWLYEPNLLALCRLCHTIVTDNPAWSDEHGFAAHCGATKIEIDQILRDSAVLREKWWDSGDPI